MMKGKAVPADKMSGEVALCGQFRGACSGTKAL